MEKKHKNQKWVFHKDMLPESPAQGVTKKVLAYCDELMCVENAFEKGAIGSMHNHPHTQITYIASGRFRFTIGDEVKEVSQGDTMLKQNAVMHGCVCLEKGILVDIFNPMREDFI